MAVASPSQPYVVNYADMRALDFPCQPAANAAANIPIGTMMMPGVTAGTNDGVCIPVTASSSADAIGLLAEPHINGQSGNATTQTLVQWFPIGALSGNNYLLGVAGSVGLSAQGWLPSHKLDLIDTFVGVKMDYAIADASSFTVTTATSSTIIANGSCAAAYDSAFVYFSAGAAIGELAFLKSSSASTSFTLVSALNVNFATGDTMVIILPLFATILPTILINSASVPQKIDTNVATGTVTAGNMANFISINNLVNRLDPLTYHKSQKLNLLSQLGFFSYFAFYDTVFHPGA